MGFADGYYYGQGRIICDTSTFSVGDTIRVRSMTDSSKVWNQQVVTVGTALVFTVPCYDYYKICTVQTINDTPTEIGGVYKTVDFGQTLFINVLDKTTLQGIQGILNSHQETELLNIGDEVTITVNGSPYTVQVALINGTSHYVEFISKNINDDNVAVGASDYQNRTDVLAWLSSFYSSIIERDRNLIKDKVVHYLPLTSSSEQTITQKIWIPTRKETMGTGSETGSQFPIFSTQENRIRYDSSGTPYANMLAGCTQVNSGGYTDYITILGVLSYTNTSIRLLPCFRLTADS